MFIAKVEMLPDIFKTQNLLRKTQARIIEDLWQEVGNIRNFFSARGIKIFLAHFLLLAL